MLNNRNTDTNECVSRATCTLSPTIAALESLAVTFLKHLSFYLLELKKSGAVNLQIQQEIIDVLASLVAVNEYSENELYEIVVNEYFILDEVKNTYLKLAKERDFEPKELILPVDFNAKTTLSQAISMGEKIMLTDEKVSLKNNLLAILLITLQSISINFVNYSKLKEFDSNLFYKIIKVINRLNLEDISVDTIKNEISKIVNLDYELQINLANAFLLHFGDISKVLVSHSTRKGKAILVSGNNFTSLYEVLKLAKENDIDVYTHSNLLIAHALGKFNGFENLRGHFGSKTENCILDFATFPGAILMTKNFRNNTEYLYRGRIFSNDYIVPKGVTKVENNDFSPIIESSLSAKGFSKGKTKEDTILGYEESEIMTKFAEIAQKLKVGQISHLYIIGIDALLERETAYYEKFLKCLKEDEFAITFSYNVQRENVLAINVGNFIPLMNRLLSQFFQQANITSSKISFFFTTCDVMTLSSIILLSSKGAKNIYMSQCVPTAVNPTTFDAFITEYNVNITDTPKKDLEAIRQKNKAS